MTTLNPIPWRRGRRALRSFALCAVAGVTLCYGPGAAAATPAVSVDHAWFRFLLPSLPAGGYMTLHNATGQPIALKAAHSSGCGMMMLHRTVSKSGQEMMVGVKSVVIPAHGDFAFQPGAYHVMCMKPQMKPGQTVAVTLEFDHAAPLTVPFHVYGATGPQSK